MTEPFTWSEGSALVAQAGSEKHLIDRVSQELDRRSWSGAKLARQMNAIGHPMSQPVVSRLLSSGDRGDRPKAVTVDQMIGLAKVLDIPFAELLLPPGARLTAEAWRRLNEAATHERDRDLAERRLRQVMNLLHRDIKKSPDFKDRVRQSRDEVQRRNEEQTRVIWEADVQTARATGEEPPSYPIGPPSPWVKVCDELLNEEKHDG